MSDLGNLHFQIHLKDYTDAEADKIKKKLESLSVHLKIDGKNVTISQTDLIKKQIEDAIKSVSVQSVKIDTSSLKTQMNTALQGVAPQISVTLLKGSLGTDLQNYLNSKTFNINISITQSSAQNAVKTAFANFSVPVNVTVSASAALQQLRQSLANRNVKVGVEAKDVNAFVADVEAKLKNKKVKVDVEPNQQHLVQAMKQALQGVSVKAQVKVDVDAQAITNAVQRAINNAHFTYNPSGKGGRGGASANSAASSQRNLGNAYHYAAQGAYQSARASVTLGRSLSTNIRIAGELGTALGTLASMFGIKDLVQGVVQIGGQLGNQRIALGAILQDGGKATEMFSKIQSLAVKSPFGIMDLNQYTKQLSAYGIEYNELYDTMKRMADISAGVGVDMGRIILAFGQVKAAGFLKGTELRQFTEANIPMVEKLAEKFSLLERRIVSAGEVYDMISEKKVTFEDVKDVLWGLTDEGGMFNNMQEVLSESLASKWKNLSDAIDVMYGKMADGRIGSWAKSLAEGLTELTKNWEYVAAAIGSATTAYTTYKVVSALGGRQIAKAHSVYTDFLQGKRTEANDLRLASSYRELTRAEQQLIATTGKLTALDARRLVQSGVLTKEMALQLIATKKLDAATKSYLTGLFRIDQQMVATAGKANWFRRAMLSVESAFRGIGAAMKGLLLNPWTWVFAAGTALAEWWADSEKKQAEIEERNRNFAESAKGSAEALERELLKIKGLDIASLNPDEMKVKVKEFTTIIKNEADGWQSILSEIFAKEADGTFKNSVEEQLKMLKTKMDELAEAKKKLMGDDEMYSDAIKATESGFWFWEKDIIDKIKAYNKAVDDNDKKLKQLGVHARDVSEALASAVGDNSALSKELSGKSLNEQVALLAEYSDEWNEFLKILSTTNPQAMGIASIWKANIPSRKDVEDGFADAKKALDNAFALKGEDISNFTERGRQAVYGFVDGMITETATQRPKMQQYMYDWWTEAYNIARNDLSYKVTTDDSEEDDDIKYDSSKDEVAKLWKKRAEEIDKAVKMYDKWKEIEGKVFAENRVKSHDELGGLFDGSYGFKLDLEDPTSAYEYIQGLLDASKSAQKELKISIGIKAEDSIYKDSKKIFDQLAEELKVQSKKTFAKWDLYKQLFELTGNKEFAKSAFDDTQVWDDATREARKKLEEAMDKQGKDPLKLDFTISDTQAKEAFEGTGGLYEMWKEIKDRIEKNGIDLKVNTANAINEVQTAEEKIKAAENKRDEELSKYKEGTADYNAVAKRWEEIIAKLKGEMFALSPAFKNLFADTAGMASSQIYEMWKQAKKLVNLINSNTTKNVENANGEIIARRFNKENGESDYINEGEFKRLLDILPSLERAAGETQIAFYRLWESVEGNGDEGYNLSMLNKDLSKALKHASKMTLEMSGVMKSMGFGSASETANSISTFLDGISLMADASASFAAGNDAAGFESLAAGINQTANAISNIKETREERAITRLRGEVKALANEFANLNKELERQLGGATSKQTDAMIQSLEDQKAKLQELVAEEEEVRAKDRDDAKIQDYKQEITEIEDQLKHFYEDLASEQYGIDIKEWAGQIADALTEAFASGQDAAEAFDKSVSDILRSLATEAIKLQFIEPAMASLREYMFGEKGIFTDNSEGNSALSANEAVGLKNELDKLKEQIASSNDYWDAINEAVGGMLDSTEKSASGLSKGIQGVTEDTADILASYLNATRADVAVNRTLIEQLVNVSVPRMSVIAEAQLQQLQMIVNNTSKNVALVGEIRDLVNTVVDKGGRKLKI